MGGGKGGGKVKYTPAPVIEYSPPDMSGQMEAFQRQLEEQRAAQEAAQAEAKRQAELKAAIEERDSFYNQRLEAENFAVEDVDNFIAEQMAQSRMRGVSFDVTDEQRLDMISNRLADYWSTDNETKMTEMFTKYGEAGPINYQLGEAGKFDNLSDLSTGVSSKAKGSTGGGDATILTSGEEDEFETLASSTLLGV